MYNTIAEIQKQSERISGYNFIQYVEKLEKDNNNISYLKGGDDFIKEVNLGNYFISGLNGSFYFYNKRFEKLFSYDLKEKIYSISEILPNKTEDSSNLIACCFDKIFLLGIFWERYFISKDKYINNKFSKESNSFLYYLEGNNPKKRVIIGDNGGISNSDSLNKLTNPQNNQFYKKPLNIGVQITEHLLIFFSNNIQSKEKKFIIFNTNLNRIQKEINLNYSFNLSRNSLALIEVNNKEKILLYACKKYFGNQKNGILLLNFDIKENEEIEVCSEKFYETNSFEVYCFCPFSIYEKDKDDILNNKYIIYKTNYFLVGGFEPNKNQGMIKLYKLINNGKKIEIKYIEDIIIKNNRDKTFRGFKGPISCIIQSTKNGNILITCWDGNAHILNCPNINFYEEDKHINDILKIKN